MSRRRVFAVAIAVFTLIVIAAAVITLWAQQQQASLSPDRILKGTAPTITITLDKSIKEIKSVRVAGQDIHVQQPGEEAKAPAQQPDADGKMSVQLPKLDIVGRADVEVLNKDDKPVAVGELTYAESAEPPSIPVLGSFKGLVLLLAYVALIVLLPILATMYDIRRSYEERGIVLAKLTDKNVKEIGALLVNMDQGPTGLVGLTRGIVAISLILVLAFVVFHLVVFAPKVPDIAEKLLMLLAGTLTAITGFYFGSKAAAAGGPQTPTGKGENGGGATPNISNVDPPSGAPPNASVTVIGEGFGKDQGTVMFNDKKGKVTHWDEKQINVTIPSDAQVGTVNIVVTNDNGDPSQPRLYTIAPAAATVPSAGETKTTISAAPKILKVDQGSGATSTKLTVTGKGFGDSQGKGTVKVGGKDALAPSWKDTQIEVTIPADVKGDISIVVTNDSGTPSDPQPFTITPALPKA